MLMVAAGSLGAGGTQLREGLLNHRIGVAGEVGASLGVVLGAVLAGVLRVQILVWLLAGAALVAAAAGGFRRGLRNRPDPEAEISLIGERTGRLAGAYQLADGGIVPCQARRVPIGLAALGVVGVVAGLTGTSGGYLKTPILSELMHVPVKVAAATTTFMVGITAASGLVVFAAQGRLDPSIGAVAVLGGLLGGWAGGKAQARVSPAIARRLLSAVLFLVAAVLVLR